MEVLTKLSVPITDVCKFSNSLKSLIKSFPATRFDLDNIFRISKYFYSVNKKYKKNLDGGKGWSFMINKLDTLQRNKKIQVIRDVYERK